MLNKMNIQKVCRTCLESTELLVNLFEESDSMKLSSKVMSIINIKIYPNDGLPVSICIRCRKRLDECIEFIHLCIKSDNDLRSAKKNEVSNIMSQDEFHKIQGNPNINTIICKKGLTVAQDIQSNDKMLMEALGGNTYQEKKSPQKQQCFACGKLMSSKFRLKTHLATHLKEKQHSCTYCEKKFTILENLNTHLRIHTGEKPYHCATCGETFAQSSGLVVHKRKHTGQKPYQCTLCPRSFQTVGNYKYHMRTHTGERNYECNICGRAFISNGDLKQHKATHNGEKPNVCCICGIRFSRASNLKRHLKYLHNEEKIYFSCQHCSLKFDQIKDLSNHKLSHKNK